MLWFVLLAAATPYEPSARVAYIEETIAAFDAADRAQIQNIEKYLHAIEKNQCHATLESLTVSCLLEAARRNCNQWPKARRPACDRISDVIMANRLSEDRFIPRRVRHEIMRERRDFRAALAEELRRRHAALVTELSLSRFADAPLPEAIARFCLERARTKDLAWQHCVAAIAWFVGTTAVEGT